MKKFISKPEDKLIEFFSIALLAIALYIMIAVILLLRSSVLHSEAIDLLEQNRAYCDGAINDFMDASDFMTAEAYEFALGGDPRHMTNYWLEVDEARTRDKAIQELIHSGLNKEELSYALRAKAYSDGLIAGETWSMRLVCESRGIPRELMPKEVRSYTLSASDEALSPAEKQRCAQNYLFGGTYTSGKAAIRSAVRDFHNGLTMRLDSAARAALEERRASSRSGIISISAMIIILIIAIVLYLIIMDRKNRELSGALEKAQAASSAKSYFTSRMSHEIRTPLNAVLGYLAIARGETNIKKQREYLDKGETAARNLLNIVNDVLDLSSIENRRLKLSHEAFSLPKLISDMQILYAAMAENKGVALEISVSGASASKTVLGDRQRTQQILANLLSNAIKFTPRGGTVRLSALAESSAGQGSRVIVRYTVQDNGIGISPDFMPHVFEPYEQADAGTAQKYGGTGLGLSIVKNMAELMGGTVSVKSEPGKGSLFAVVLPYDAGPAAAASERDSGGAETASAGAAATGSQGGSGRLSGMRILLAEDNQMNREIATAFLSALGASVFSAADGLEAAELFERSAPGSFDVILMDIMMPRLSGYEATKRIRACGRRQAADIPIIAMTANAFSEDVQAALDAGMNGHLAKPFDIEELVQLLAPYAGRSQSSGQGHE